MGGTQLTNDYAFLNTTEIGLGYSLKSFVPHSLLVRSLIYIILMLLARSTTYPKIRQPSRVKRRLGCCDIKF